jgi:hypothetical protein
MQVTVSSKKLVDNGQPSTKCVASNYIELLKVINNKKKERKKKVH